jgi:hypothetical protein
VPSGQIGNHYPKLSPSAECQWINLYDVDDIIAFPLNMLNGNYTKIIRDCEVRVSDWNFGWTPWAHTGYWTNETMIDEVCAKINRAWDAMP